MSFQLNAATRLQAAHADIPQAVKYLQSIGIKVVPKPVVDKNEVVCFKSTMTYEVCVKKLAEFAKKPSSNIKCYHTDAENTHYNFKTGGHDAANGISISNADADSPMGEGVFITMRDHGLDEETLDANAAKLKEEIVLSEKDFFAMGVRNGYFSQDDKIGEFQPVFKGLTTVGEVPVACTRYKVYLQGHESDPLVYKVQRDANDPAKLIIKDETL